MTEVESTPAAADAPTKPELEVVVDQSQPSIANGHEETNGDATDKSKAEENPSNGVKEDAPAAVNGDEVTAAPVAKNGSVKKGSKKEKVANGTDPATPKKVKHVPQPDTDTMEWLTAIDDRWSTHKKVAYALLKWLNGIQESDELTKLLSERAAKQSVSIEQFLDKVKTALEQCNICKLTNALDPNTAVEVDEKADLEQNYQRFHDFCVKSAGLVQADVFTLSDLTGGEDKHKQVMSTLIKLALVCEEKFEKKGITKKEFDEFQLNPIAKGLGMVKSSASKVVKTLKRRSQSMPGPGASESANEINHQNDAVTAEPEPVPEAVSESVPKTVEETVTKDDAVEPSPASAVLPTTTVSG